MNQHNPKPQQQAVEQGLLGYVIKLCQNETQGSVLKKAMGIVTAIGGGPYEVAQDVLAQNAHLLLPVFYQHTSHPDAPVRSKAMNLLALLYSLNRAVCEPILEAMHVETVVASALSSGNRNEVDTALALLREMRKANSGLLPRFSPALQEGVQVLRASEDDFQDEIAECEELLGQADPAVR